MITICSWHTYSLKTEKSKLILNPLPIFYFFFKSDGSSARALKIPVNVTLRRFAHGSDAVSACWNMSLDGGQGGWRSGCCRILDQQDNFTALSCNSLGNYGVLMVGGASRGQPRPLFTSNMAYHTVAILFLTFKSNVGNTGLFF